MSKPHSSQQLNEQIQRIQSFRNLLDPTDLLPGHNVADVYSLRHLCLQSGGIPDNSTSSQDGWLRAQAWRVLLGYLSPEKSEWSATLKKRRAEYYQFVEDFLPKEEDDDGEGQDPSSSSSSTRPNQASLPGNLSERDALLDQIFRDLARSRKNAFAFYRQEVRSSFECPLAPLPTTSKRGEILSGAVQRLKSRYSLLRRLEKINVDYAHAIQQERQLNSHSRTKSTENSSSNSKRKDTLMATSPQTPIREDDSIKPSITLQPASPAQEVESLKSDDPFERHLRKHGKNNSTAKEQTYIDRHWHSLLRILYIYALLNPSMGYVQGMNEVLFILLYVLGTSSGLPYSNADDQDEEGVQNGTKHFQGETGEHAEADAFWCFSALIGEVRDLYDFDGVDHASAKLQVSNKRQQSNTISRKEASGMGSLLHRFSLRLRWLDDELWKGLREHSLDPRLPYYSFRWLACLLSTELSLPSIVRVWDALLAESSENSGADSDGTSPKVDFLIDISCSLLINIRGLLLDAINAQENKEEDSFSNAIDVLQNYPDEDIGPILEMACLYRQKRLAAPLTGDGPPKEDEEDLNSTLRGRALNAFKEWRSTSASFSATPRRVSEGISAGNNFPSSSSPATRLQKYADAIQQSDAAASISKASTNWQAKAMATWSATKSAQSTPSKEGRTPSEVGNSSFSEMGSNWFQKLRSGSETYASPRTNKEENETHPSLRWSTVPPHLPIPNVLDSPPERQEYSQGGRTHSGFISVNRLAAANALGEGSVRDNRDIASSTRSSPGSRSSFEGMNDEITSSQNNSPATTSFSRFAHLPSLQHAAAVSGVRGSPKPTSKHQQSHSSPHNHHGLQPLMLSNSARPAREHSSSGSVNGDEPMSRKVASGPMAANVSPRGSAFASRRRNDNHSYGGNGSHRDSAFTTTSFSSSVFRSGDHTESFASSQAGDSPLPDSHGSESWSHINRSMAVDDPIPPLPIKDYKRPSVEGLPLNSSTDGPAFSLTSGRSTVNASAFGRNNNALRSVGEGKTSEDGPTFGHVTSSADVPLTSKSTLQRKTRARQGSASTSTEASSSMVQNPMETEEILATRDSEGVESNLNNSTSPPISSTQRFSAQSAARVQGPRQSRTRESLGYYVNPRSVPVPPPTGTTSNEGISSSGSSLIEKVSLDENEADDDEQNTVIGKEKRKYSLTDDGPFTGSSNVIRQTSNSSTKRASGGIARNRRAFSGKREPSGKRRGSNRESQNSVISPSESIRRDLQDEEIGFSNEPQEGLSVANLSIVESGTSLTPSPGPEVGKMFRAEELMKMLEESSRSTGDGNLKVKSDHLSIHGFDQPEFVSAEDIRQEDFDNSQQSKTIEKSTNYNSTLLGPRSKRPINMPSDVNDSENESFEHGVGGGESGGEAEEWHETNIESNSPEENEIGSAKNPDKKSKYGPTHNYV